MAASVTLSITATATEAPMPRSLEPPLSCGTAWVVAFVAEVALRLKLAPARSRLAPLNMRAATRVSTTFTASEPATPVWMPSPAPEVASTS